MAWEKKREGSRIIASSRFFIGIELAKKDTKKMLK
jgi:hypothetical protein